MTFMDAIKTCFSKYVTFAGRASRPEYWYWCLFSLLGIICTFVIDGLILNDLENTPVNLLFSVITFLPGLAVSVRRLHDVNRSGWWVLLLFTVIGLILLLYWALRKSDEGENRFGALEIQYDNN
jgi:uncharacterized membrane protein YhaH (DUF805 family)